LQTLFAIIPYKSEEDFYDSRQENGQTRKVEKGTGSQKGTEENVLIRSDRYCPYG